MTKVTNANAWNRKVKDNIQKQMKWFIIEKFLFLMDFMSFDHIYIILPNIYQVTWAQLHILADPFFFLLSLTLVCINLNI